MLQSGLYITLGFTASAMLMSWLYFRHYQINRPPIGTFNLLDVAFMIVAIILVPCLYLVIPVWLMVGLLLLGVVSILYFALEPVVPARRLIWLMSIALPGADLAAYFLIGPKAREFFGLNNLLLVIVTVGLTNLWAQSGMKARDATVLAAVVAVYDFIATWRLPFMTKLMTRLAGLPLSPQIAWPVTGQVSSYTWWIGIGLGDVLLTSVFPLLMRKAFGYSAGLTALIIAMGAMTAMFLIPFERLFPAMVVLGPLMVLQYLAWRCRGEERTTWQYRQSEAVRR